MNPSIIFEDDSILVLEKSAGWTIDVLQEWVRDNFDFEIAKDREFRNGLVHRLDKDTSGIIIFAKTKESFERIQKQFADRTVKKTYIALVHGKVLNEEGLIDAPVGRLPWKRTRFGVLEEGREAQTKYKVKNYYNDYTLLELYPQTGRTHQIRVHLKHIKHPIVGDILYAGRKTAKADRRICPRMFLHAESIQFVHPQSGEIVNFKSELPNELQVFISTLHASQV